MDWTKEELAEIERDSAVKPIENESWIMTGAQYAGKTLLGMGAGAGEFVAETAETLVDVGFQSAVGYASLFDIVAGIDPNETDYNAMAKKKDKWVDETLSFMKSDDLKNEPYYNFVKNTTDTALKFGTIYGLAKNAGLKAGASLATAAAGEGLINDPDDEMLFMEGGLRKALETYAPDQVENFNSIMDPNTDSYIARQNIRRVMNGLETGLITLGTFGLARGGGAVGGWVYNKIPPESIKQMQGLYGETLKNLRVVKEKAFGQTAATAKSPTATKTMVDGTLETKITVQDVAYDPKKTATENIKEMVKVDYDSTSRLKTEQDYLDKLSDYEKKLESLVPEIQGKITNMAKVQGISEKEALEKFEAELGVGSIVGTRDQGLKTVLRQQAQNMLMEQETAKFAMAYKRLKTMEGKPEYAQAMDDVLEQTQSTLLAFFQGEATSSAAGRVLKAKSMRAQPVKSAGESIKSTYEFFAGGKSMNSAEITENYLASMKDPEQIKAVAEGLAHSMNMKKLLDIPDDDFAAVLKFIGSDPTKIAENAQKVPGILYFAKNVTDSIGRATQANLLTATTTMTQNTFGTALFQFVKAGEKFMQVGVPNSGQTLVSATAHLNGLIKGYVYSYKGLVAAIKKTDPTIGRIDNFRQTMADIPMLDTATKRRLASIDKSEVQTMSENPLWEGAQKSVFGKVATGGWAFDVIGVQDSIAKSGSVYASMQEQYARALSQDVFGVADGLVDEKKAYKMLNDMFMQGKDGLTPQEIAAYGIPLDKARLIGGKMAEWRTAASKQAYDDAVSSVFQKPLQGSGEAARRLFQDSLGGLMKTQVPFFTTPVRILDEATKRMPLIPLGDEGMGLPLRLSTYKRIMAGGEQRAEAISEIMMGNLLSISAFQMAEMGYIAPAQEQGIKSGFVQDTFGLAPNSVLFQGKSYALAPTGPVGIAMSIGSGMFAHREMMARTQHMDQEVEQQYLDMQLHNMANLVEGIKESPFFTGAESIMDILDVAGVGGMDPRMQEKADQFVDKFVGRVFGNLVPGSSLQRQISNNQMEWRKKAQGMSEHFAAQFAPYLIEQNAVDGWGNLVEPNKGWFFRYRNVQPVDVEYEAFMEFNYHPDTPRFKYNYRTNQMVFGQSMAVPVDLAKEGVWNRWNEIRADKLKSRIRAEMGSPEMLDIIRFGRKEEASKVFDSIIADQERRAFEIILEENPRLKNVIVDGMLERKKLGQKPIGYVPKTNTVPTFSGGQ